MGRVLPGSSEPTAYEVAQLQQWCDHARAISRTASIDRSDEEACLQHILEIVLERGEQRSGGGQRRFKNLRCVGTGAYGMVFSAVDRERAGQSVAVKILRPSKRMDRVSMERFEEESRILCRLDHPHILKLHSHGYTAGLPYLVLELADGQSLAARMREKGEWLSVRESVVLVSRLADALQELHSNAIVHRDVKPSNILLRKESRDDGSGVEYRPLLSDFGLSKTLQLEPASGLTLHGEVLGTLAYMSPEQIRGESLKTQSDLFSLGVILYELVYGVHPFLSASDYQTRTNIVQRDPLRPAKTHQRISPALAAILSKCLQKEISKRYQHASEVSKDLNCFLRGEAVSVTRPTAWQSFSQFVGVHRVASTFLGTLLISMTLMIGLLSREWSVQRGLAKSNQLLADDRAEIIQLFLESMRVTNSGMNDQILSGLRVLPSELLESLKKQIPLLERSHKLAPNDASLQNHLQIMLHYASICYLSEKDFALAVEARGRSLSLIEGLLQTSPTDSLVMARINGAYWMGVCLHASRRSDESVEWYRRAIHFIEDMPATHPNYPNALETRCGIRLQIANEIKERSLDEALSLLSVNSSESVEAYNRTKLPGCFVYALHSLREETKWSLLDGRLERGKQLQQRFEELIDGYRDLLVADWTTQDCVFYHLIQVGSAFAKKGMYSELGQIVSLWEKWIEEVPRGEAFGRLGWYRQSPEVFALFSIYMRWLASSHDPGTSSEGLMLLEGELRSAVRTCLSHPSNDMALYLEHMQREAFPTEKLEEVIAAFKDGP
jgi:serine/threonine protein kinase